MNKLYFFEQSCEALEHVDRLGGVAYEQLLDGYLNRDAPLIVVDAMESWPVMNTDDFWFDNITQVSYCNIFYDLKADLFITSYCADMLYAKNVVNTEY